VSHEAVVELVGHIVAESTELLVECGNGDHAGGIASWGDGDFDKWDALAVDFVGFRLEAEAVNIVLVGVWGEIDDEIEAFFRSNGGEAEEVGDVDDADAADFDVATGKGGGAGGEFAVCPADAHHIVGDECGAAFEHADGGFTLTSTAFSHDQDADAAHVDHAAVKGGGWGKLAFQLEGGEVEELHRHQLGGKDGDGVFSGDREHVLGKLDTSGHDDGRNVALAHAEEAFLAHRWCELLQVGHLGVSEDLDAFFREVGEEACEGEAGSVRGGFADQVVEALFFADEFHRERFAVPFEELADGDGGGLLDPWWHGGE